MNAITRERHEELKVRIEPLLQQVDLDQGTVGLSVAAGFSPEAAATMPELSQFKSLVATEEELPALHQALAQGLSAELAQRIGSIRFRPGDELPAQALGSANPLSPGTGCASG